MSLFHLSNHELKLQLNIWKYLCKCSSTGVALLVLVRSWGYAELPWVRWEWMINTIFWSINEEKKKQIGSKLTIIIWSIPVKTKNFFLYILNQLDESLCLQMSSLIVKSDKWKAYIFVQQIYEMFRNKINQLLFEISIQTAFVCSYICLQNYRPIIFNNRKYRKIS